MNPKPFDSIATGVYVPDVRSHAGSPYEAQSFRFSFRNPVPCGNRMPAWLHTGLQPKRAIEPRLAQAGRGFSFCHSLDFRTVFDTGHTAKARSDVPGCRRCGAGATVKTKPCRSPIIRPSNGKEGWVMPLFAFVPLPSLSVRV